MIVTSLLLCVLLLVLLSLYFRYNRPGRLIAKVPGPRPLPLIGNALDIFLDSEKLFNFTRSMAKYGSISKLCGLNLRAINIYDPEDLKVILSSAKFNEKYYPYTFMRPWLGNGLLVNNGGSWHQRRKMLTPAFHFSILNRFIATMVRYTDEMVLTLQEKVNNPQDINPVITQTTLRIISETSMGIKLKNDKASESYRDSLYTIGQCFLNRLINGILYPNIIFNWSSAGKVQKVTVKKLHRFTRNVISDRKRQRDLLDKEKNTFERDDVYATKRMAMLDLLLEEEKLGNIDEEGIREEVDTFVFEGHDTTSTALCFMMMRIANEPAVQNLIHEELHSIFGDSDRPPTVQDLSDMKYLERCIKESLRLYPGVPYIARQLNEEVVLSGYTIPAHTTCNIQVFDIHRNGDVFPDPERFDPDRFLPENTVKRHPYAYIPFSAGPRNCIGQKFALMEMKVVMSGVLRRYRLEPVTTPQDLVFLCDVVLRTKHPVYVRLCNKK